MKESDCIVSFLQILDDSEVDAEERGEAGPDRSIEDQLMSGLRQMSLNDDAGGADAEARRFMNKDNPLFNEMTPSTKVLCFYLTLTCSATSEMSGQLS